MTEPTLSSAALYKTLSLIMGATMAATVVMFMNQPKSPKEWFCAVVTTLFCSISLGAFLVTYYPAFHQIPDFYQAQIMGGVYFISGMPGWFVVRIIFHTIDRFQHKDAITIYEEFKK